MMQLAIPFPLLQQDLPGVVKFLCASGIYEVTNVLSEDLIGRPAVHAFGSSVPVGNEIMFHVSHGNPVGSLIEQGGLLPQLQYSALPLRDVTDKNRKTA